MPESEMERLLDTRAGKALAHAAWSEGAGAMLRACNHEGAWAKPDNPYSAPLIAAIRESRDAPPRPPWVDPLACWAHCAPGWRVPCDETDREHACEGEFLPSERARHHATGSTDREPSDGSS